MKAKFKKFFMIVGILSILVILALVMLFVPESATKVAEWTGTTTQRVKDTAVSVIGTAIGLLLISFGVAALAVPVVGISLIVIGVVLGGWSLYTSGWFGNSAARIPIDDKSKLQKVV
jgi:hypothetical protein